MLRQVIQSWGNAATEDFFHGRKTAAARKVPTDIHDRLSRKLDALNAAAALSDLSAMPGGNLEALKGVRKGQHSVRINAQWRVTFRWTTEGPTDVAWEDHH